MGGSSPNVTASRRKEQDLHRVGYRGEGFKGTIPGEKRCIMCALK